MTFSLNDNISRCVHVCGDFELLASSFSIVEFEYILLFGEDARRSTS